MSMVVRLLCGYSSFVIMCVICLICVILRSVPVLCDADYALVVFPYVDSCMRFACSPVVLLSVVSSVCACIMILVVCVSHVSRMLCFYIVS